MPVDKLNEIRKQIDRGIAPPPVTVRKFLTWFDMSRRSSGGVNRIRECLEEARLETDPDFEFEFIEGNFSFIQSGSKEISPNSQETFRIGQLESANRKPVFIKPDKALCEAET
jgi:hypothetical protein